MQRGVDDRKDLIYGLKLKGQVLPSERRITTMSPRPFTYEKQSISKVKDDFA